MKKTVAILLTILMLFTLFQGALRENIAKAEEVEWQELSTGSNGLMKDIGISAVAINPKNSNVIYVGTDYYGVYKSEDGGSTWKAISSSVTEMTNVLSLAIDPKNTNTLYTGLFNFGRPRIYKSEDGGSTWKMLEKAPQFPVYTLAIDPNNTNVIFTYSRSDGVYRSDDGGLNWKKLDLSVENLWWCHIAIDPKNSNIVYAVQYGPIYKSEDKGDHWTKIWQVEKNGNLGAIMCVAIDPNDTNVLYAGTDGYGIFKSIDKGKSWTQTSLSIANDDSILINPTNPAAMYAIDNVRGVSGVIEETLDGWKSWKYMDEKGLPTDMDSKKGIVQGTTLRSLAIDSKGNLFLGTVKGFFKYAVQVSPPPTSGKLIFALPSEPDYIVSFLTYMLVSEPIIGATEAKLIGEKPDGSLFPDLSKNVPNIADGTWSIYEVNGKTYMKTTYYLREGVKWSDGVPIDYQQDIKFGTYDVYLSGKVPNLSTDPYDKIEKIEFPDPYTMVVTWNALTPYANAGLPIFPKHYYSQVSLDKIASSTLVNTPVHAGPYKVKEWVKGSYISIVPNPYYYGNQPKIAEIVFKWISDTNTALLNIVSGVVDVTYLCLDVPQVNQAKSVPGVTVQNVPSTFWEHLEINCTDPILSDVRVRKAIAYGIDYDNLNNRVFFGQRRVSYYPYISLLNEFYRNPNAVMPKYDPAMANKLLDDAGWKMGSDGYRYKDGKRLTLELSTNTRQERKDEAIVLQAQLKQIGIDIQTKILSFTYLIETYWTHRMFQLTMFSWGGDPLDPDGFWFYHSSQIPTQANNWQGQNFTGISDSTLDDAIYKATHEVDQVVRQKNYYIAEQRIVDLVPQIGLNQWTDIVTYKNFIKGIDYPLSSGIPITWNVQDWYIGFNITASASQGGAISPSGSVSVIPGNPQTFTITPNTGYKIKDIKVDRVSVGAVSTYTFTNIASDHAIEATFEPLTFSITSSAASGGTIFPSGTITLNYGESKTFTITTNPGYKISNVKVDGVSKGSISLYTFTNVTSDHTISVTFEEEKKETVIILQIGDQNFTVNGVQNTLDSPPVIKNNRTLLPIRAVVEALSGTIGWEATERKVTVTLGSKTIELWIGKNIAKVNGIDTPIDSTNSKVVPEIINGRTMLPLRFVTENLGCNVQWDGPTQTITITYQGG
jgi:ABC-type transport system substrate-binding protein